MMKKYMHGSDDGVVAVPRNRAEGVLKKAKETLERGKTWLDGIGQGKSTLEVIGLDKKLDELDIKISKRQGD